MKKAAVFVLFSFVASCQFFEKQVPNEDELLQKRLSEINWNEVSAYPSLPECEVITDKEQKKQCFFEVMAKLIQEKLLADTLALPLPEADTIEVKVTIFSDATLRFEPHFPQDSTSHNKAAIDSIIKARLHDFPVIEPAQKEGVPVTTQFTLPVILNMQQ